jgi:hypothetical protein
MQEGKLLQKLRSMWENNINMEVVILFAYIDWVRLVHGAALWVPHFTSLLHNIWEIPSLKARIITPSIRALSHLVVYLNFLWSNTEFLSPYTLYFEIMDKKWYNIAQCNSPEIACAGVAHPSTFIGNHCYGDRRSSFFADHLQEYWDIPLTYIANKFFETHKYSSLNTAFLPLPIIYNFSFKIP